MKILLNDLELARRAEGETTLGDVLSSLQAEIAAAGKIIIRTVVDGKPLPTGWQRRKLLSVGVDSIQQLQLMIEDAHSLKQQTLLDARQLAGRLMEQTKPLGRKFRMGDEVVANTELAAFLDDIKLVFAGLDHSTRGEDPQGTLTPIRDRLIDSANRMLPTLDRIYKAQAYGDYIALADEIEYDLHDQITVWPDLLEEAKRCLQEPGQSC